MSQNRKGGLPRSSHRKVRTSKKHSQSEVPASSAETFSNFFIKKSPPTEMSQKITEDENCKYVNTESPYKNLIKTNTQMILNDSASDAADFKSPRPTRKPRNLTSVLGKPVQEGTSKDNKSQKGQSKRGRGRPKCSSKNSIAKIFTDNLKYFGENPEHMQMAIALSKSSYETECGSSGQSPSKDDISNIGDILRNAKPALLESFGFTSCSNVMPVEKRRLAMASSEGTKKNKNRFKYITPILNIRTSEKRNALIDSKISHILYQNNPQPKELHEYVLNSNVLSNCCSRERSIFDLDDIYQKNNFYVKCLEIPQTICRCDHLLKNWDLIPGREKSPCKITRNDSTEEEAANNKEKDTHLSPSRYRHKILNDKQGTRRETASSESASQAKTVANSSAYLHCPIKHLSDTSNIGASCSFSISANIQETIFGSFSTESKDSAVSTSFTSSGKSTVYSFNSSCRSISPNLFDSDDEIDQQFLSEARENIPENVSMLTTNTENIRISSFEADENKLDSPQKLRGNLEAVIKSGQKVIENYSLQKNSVASALPNEIIYLTDDDDDSSSQSPNKSLLSNIDIVLEANEDCISSHKRKQIEKSYITAKPNIYNLDEFENDKMDSSPENIDYFKGIPDENIECLNKEVVKIPEEKNSFGSKDDDERLAVTTKENCNITDSVEMDGNDKVASNSNSSFTDIDIASDELTLICKSFSLSKSPNCIKDPSLSTSIINKTTNCHDNVYIILDSPESPDFLSNEECELKQVGSLNYTPKRDQRYIRQSSFYTKALSDKSNTSDSSEVNNETSGLGETPKKYVESRNVMSPCFDEPVFYDSTNLNVTAYVHNISDIENIQFNKTNPVETRELKDNNDEEMSLSQSSQSSAIADEELNYSSHFATPARSNESRNEIKYFYEDETEKMEEIIHISPELLDCNLEKPPHNNVSVKPAIVPKATVTNPTSTPDNFIIKTDNVTPMPEYDKMATPLINKELQKVGVKPLKRTRGAKLLRYIYESTHPSVGPEETIVFDNSESDEDRKVIKRRKTADSNEDLNNLQCATSVMKSLVSSRSLYASSIEIIGDEIIKNEELEDLIFERKQLTKISSCKVPLQIVWHNLVSSDQAIKENILLYEPLQLESLHIMLKEQGFKFHIQDLLTFLDKKCITIRTAQKQGKMHR